MAPIHSREPNWITESNNVKNSVQFDGLKEKIIFFLGEHSPLALQPFGLEILGN
jgi:hypothetical protein